MQETSLRVSAYDGDRLLGNQYDLPPRYFIYGGLVFTPLSLDYLKSLGRDWRDVTNSEIVYELYYRRFEQPKTARPEPIILATTLAHEVNADLKITRRALVDRINGTRIERLEDVVQAFESATNTHHVIEFLPSRAIETLARAAADGVRLRFSWRYSRPMRCCPIPGGAPSTMPLCPPKKR